MKPKIINPPTSLTFKDINSGKYFINEAGDLFMKFSLEGVGYNAIAIGAEQTSADPVFRTFHEGVIIKQVKLREVVVVVEY